MKNASQTTLRAAIASLDETASRVNGTTRKVDALGELRTWRIEMAKRFIGLSIMPAQRGKK